MSATVANTAPRLSVVFPGLPGSAAAGAGPDTARNPGRSRNDCGANVAWAQMPSVVPQFRYHIWILRCVALDSQPDIHRAAIDDAERPDRRRLSRGARRAPQIKDAPDSVPFQSHSASRFRLVYPLPPGKSDKKYKKFRAEIRGERP